MNTVSSTIQGLLVDQAVTITVAGIEVDCVRQEVEYDPGDKQVEYRLGADLGVDVLVVPDGFAREHYWGVNAYSAEDRVLRPDRSRTLAAVLEAAADLADYLNDMGVAA